MDKESRLNPPKTMFDIECWEATQFIKLPFFLAVLRFSPLTKDSDTTDLFIRLMDKGLPLRFSEPGYCFDDEIIHKSDVKCALHRIDDALSETDTPEIKLFSQQIIKTEGGNDISLAGILIGRKDVSDIFAQMGFESYPWAKVPWPTTQTEFSDFPIIKTDVFNNHMEIASEHHGKSQKLGNDAPVRMQEAASLNNTPLQSVENNTAGLDSETKQVGARLDNVSNRCNAKKLRTRKINLVRAIENAVCKLRIKLGKKPSIDELWQYFEDGLDESGFIEDNTDTHLIWRTTKGDLKDSPKSTVANHLSRIKF